MGSADFTTSMISSSFRVLALSLVGFFATNLVAKQVMPATPVAERSGVNEWLMRMHEASQKQAYTGTYVVSSGATMSSAKIWHACEGAHQVERVEILTGVPRSIFRNNDKVVTFMPGQKLVRIERRQLAGAFPQLLQSHDGRLADFYDFRREGFDRIAGQDAEVVSLLPKDRLRFGYRIWAERRRGLIVKLQTLGNDGAVLEQAAFTELQLDAPVSMDRLLRMMGKVEGYRIEEPLLVKTTASAEGWTLKAAVPGFRSLSCYRRPASSQSLYNEPLQWIFSDGLAAVSVFVEPYDPRQHGKESAVSVGATQTVTRQLGAYWITVMGEVPVSTLRQFAESLERSR